MKQEGLGAQLGQSVAGGATEVRCMGDMAMQQVAGAGGDTHGSLRKDPHEQTARDLGLAWDLGLLACPQPCSFSQRNPPFQYCLGGMTQS